MKLLSPLRFCSDNKVETAKDSFGYNVQLKCEFNTLGRNCHINPVEDFTPNTPSSTCVHKA